MKDIDYEAIMKEAAAKTDGLGPTTGYVKAIIDAYKAQKRPPEWVPLDLEKVVQGQEVRHASWTDGYARKFVGHYKDGIVSASDTEAFEWYLHRGQTWFMRAPKTKTVCVQVMRRGNEEYVAMHACVPPPTGFVVVGAGEIEVRE